MCHTARVSFNETFWVVTGTAAPVIALAGTIALADAGGDRARFTLYSRSFEVVKTGAIPVYPGSRDYARRLTALMTLDLLNLAGQGLVLFASLVSLLNHHNWMAPRVPIACTVLGIVALAVSSVAVATTRRTWAAEMEWRAADVLRRSSPWQAAGSRWGDLTRVHCARP
jgi:hypothetical protein